MILPCSIKWPEKMEGLSGKPNNFPEKIWMSLCDGNTDIELIFSDYESGFERVGYEFDPDIHLYEPKFHSIREDKHDRWKAGQLIHFYINNRTPKMFQFAPAIRCVSTQAIEIRYYQFKKGKRTIQVSIKTDKPWSRLWIVAQDEEGFIEMDRRQSDTLERLAIYDGFPSLNEFFQWFDSDFKGKIIHWTNLRY